MGFFIHCRRGAYLALIITLLLFDVGQTFAQTNAWSTATTLSASGQSAGSARVALSSDGTRATAIWLRSDGTANRIQSASATVDGNVPTWSSPTTLSAAGQPATEPEIALSDDGTKAVAIWYRNDGANQIIQAATATISGNTATWSAAQDLSAAGQDAGNPFVALSSDGTKAIAIWHRSNGTNEIIQAATATISSNTATWSASQDLSAAGQNASIPEVAISDDGTKATAIFVRNNGSIDVAQSVSATIAGNVASWSASTDLSSTDGVISVRMALSADGSMATALWRRGSNEDQVIQSASATISGNTADWSMSTDISVVGENVIFPVLALSDDGTVASAAWYNTTGDYFAVRSATATVSGNTADWSDSIEISTTGLNSYFVDIALSEEGSNAVALWTSIDGVVPSSVGAESAKNIIQSSTGFIEGNTSEWTTPDFISDDEQDANFSRVAISSDGRWATAVWARSDGTNFRIQASSADLDFCPNDESKVLPGICGCGVADTDTDGDGTADCDDECDSDASKIAAGICGCGIADTDGDSDGTADCNDECSEDSNKIVAGDCGCGIADTDSDGNDVSDCLDVAETVKKTFTNKSSKKATKKLTTQLKSQKKIARSLLNNGKIDSKLFKQVKKKANRIKFLLRRAKKQGNSNSGSSAKLSKSYNKKLKKLQEALSS